MRNHYAALKDAELGQRQFGVQLRTGDRKTDVYLGDNTPIIWRPHAGEPGQREAVLAWLGLIPWFTTSQKLAYSTMNARTESVATTVPAPVAHRAGAAIFRTVL